MCAIAEIIKNNSKIKSISIVIEDSLSKFLNQTVAEFTENSLFYLLNNLYYYDELKSKPKKLSLKSINMITLHNQISAIRNAQHTTEAMYLVRDLGNGPSNIVNPAYLAKTAKEFEKISKKVTVQILEEKDIKKLRNEIGFEFIENRKKELYLYLLEELKSIQNLLIYGNKKSHNIGIVSLDRKSVV